jgi:hypothetical protein
MSAFEDFIAACADDEFTFKMKVMPFAGGGMRKPPPRRLQREVYQELSNQLLGHVLHACKKYPDDHWKPFPVLSRAEKIITIYVEQEYDELIPLQQEVRQHLHTRWRMVRRRYIRAALKCPDHERPIYEKTFKGAMFNENRWGRPGDIAEDFRATERHVYYGTRLFAGLKQSCVSRKAQAIAAWRGLAKLPGELIESNAEAATAEALDPSIGRKQHDATHSHGARAPPPETEHWCVPPVRLKGDGG